MQRLAIERRLFSKVVSPQQAALYESNAMGVLQDIPDTILTSKNLVSAQRIQNLRFHEDEGTLSMDLVTPSPVLSKHAEKAS